MSEFFIWVRGDVIPYQIYSFFSPIKVLKLNHSRGLEKYFKDLEEEIKKVIMHVVFYL